MKLFLIFAATLAATTSISATSATERPGGHYEWQNRPVYGPNKSNIPSRVRVWVKDATDMASCNCAMMRDKAKSADCMAMSSHDARHSKG